MGHSVDTNGVLTTEVDNTLLKQTDVQTVGFEQFVSATSVKIVEELPSYTNYMQEFSFAMPLMTNNGHPTGSVFSNLVGDERINAYKVFSRDTSTSVRWENPHGWIKYDAEKPLFVTRYVLTTPYSGDVNSLPRSWKLLGSADDRNWVVIDSRNYKTLELGRKYAFDCIAPHSYRYLKFEWTETRGNVGYSVLGTIDYYGVKSLAFNEDFDASMPIITVDTEYQEALTHFPAVRRNRDYKFDADPFGDGSQLCYFPLNGDLQDVTGNQVATANYTPIYSDLEDGYKALDYMSYNSGQSIRTADKLPLTGAEGLTTCAWVQISVINYNQYLNIWHISIDNANNQRTQALWLYSGNTRVIHSHVNNDGVTITKNSAEVMQPNKWQFLVMRQTKNSYEIILDGKIVDGATTYKTVDWLEEGYLYIGDRWYYKAHLIYDFRVFNRCLTDSELFTLQSSGKTIATLTDQKMPLAFTIFDSEYKLNGKTIPTVIEDIEVVKTRKKYRYVDYRMTGGSSINSYCYIDEIDVQDEGGASLAIGKPVIAYYTGTNNKQVIVDGIKDNSAYYGSNTSAAYIRIDLGEPKDIKYIQNWNYFKDNRTFNNIMITLTNNPTYAYEDEYDLVFKTEYSGKYTETSNGKISSNLNFDYTFKIEYSCDEILYPAEYYLDTTIFFPRKGTKFHELKFEVNRNLWHVKPRLLKSVNEKMLLEDRGHLVTPRRQIVSEGMQLLENTKAGMPPKLTQNEEVGVNDVPTHIVTIGTPISNLESNSLFENTSFVVAGAGAYSVIAKVINETVEVTDFTTKYIRYNVCGQDAGIRVVPMEYVNQEEVTYWFRNRHPNKAIQLVETLEVITGIVTVGTVGTDGIDNTDINELVDSIITVGTVAINPPEDVTLQETVLAIIA